jgi:hypothetical protein
MPSALFQIDPGTAVYGAAGVAQDASHLGVTVNCKLVSTSGAHTIAWTNFGTHSSSQAQVTPSLSGSPSGQIASFVIVAGKGQSYGIRCKVTDANGNSDTQTSAVYVLDDVGRRPFFIGETFERNSTHAVVEDLNAIGAAAAGGGSSAWKVPAKAATTAALPANTYSAATKRLTADANGALASQDTIALSVGEVLLVKDEGGGASHTDNGPYSVIDLGDGASPYILERISTADATDEIYDGMMVVVAEGATYAGHQFNQVTTVVALDTTALEFKDQGFLGALATTSDQGSVPSVGAANTIAQSDGANPVWRTNLRTGSDPTSSGAISMSPATGIYQKETTAGAAHLLIGLDASDNTLVGEATNGADTYVSAPAAQSVVLRSATTPVLTVAAALITCAQPVVVANTAMSGSEQLRITGGLRLDESVGDLAYIEITDGDNAGVSPSGAARLRWVGGATNKLQLSENGGAYGPLGGVTGSGTDHHLTRWDTSGVQDTGIVCDDSNNLSWLATVTAPSLSQATTAVTDAVGYALTHHAQDVSGAYSASNPKGGAFIARSGGNDSATAANVDSGNVEVYCGAVKASGARGTLYLGRDAAGTAANRPQNTVIDAASLLYLQINGGTYGLLSTSYFELGVSELRFDKLKISPVLCHETETATDGQGETFTDHAQDVSGAFSAVNPRGGDKVVRSGGDDSASAANVDSGNLELYCGAQKGTGARGNVYVGIDAGDTAVNRCGTMYLDATSAIALQIGGSTVLQVETSLLAPRKSIRFTADVAAPSLYQAQHASGAGVNMTMQAQQGKAGYAGGSLLLIGGDDGSTAGNGGVEVYPGTYGGGTRASVYIGIDSGLTAANRAENVVIEADGYIQLKYQTGSRFIAGATSNTSYVDLVLHKTVVAPGLYQSTETATDGQGETLTCHAQDVSGAFSAVNPRGGNKIIRSGGDDSASAANVDSGHMQVSCGAIKASGVRGNAYFGRAADGTAEYRAGNTYIDAQTTTELQYQGTAHLTVDANYVEGSKPLVVPSFAVAGAPTGKAGALGYCTNGDTGSACFTVHDGSNWKVVSLGATISAT